MQALAREDGPDRWTSHCGGAPLSAAKLWGGSDHRVFACPRHAPADAAPWSRPWPAAQVERAFGARVVSLRVEDVGDDPWRLVVTTDAGRLSLPWDEAHARLAALLGWDALPSPADRVVPDGRGFLFAGHSGDGKTTMARLWEALPGAVVLSDDRIVVKEGPAGRWEMFGTPWHGEAELAANVRAEVAGIFVLGRGPRNRLGTMSRSEAVSALLARSFPPFHASDGMSRALELLDRLSLAARVERFEVRPGPEAVETVLTWGR